MAAKKRRFDLKQSPQPWRVADDGTTMLDADNNEIGAMRDFSEEDWNLILSAPTLFLAAKRVHEALRAYGPTDDGTPQGREVEAAMDCLRDAMFFAKYGMPVDDTEPDIF